MSGALATWTVELGLGGSYRESVLATSGLVSYWPMDELRGVSAEDHQGTHDGAYVNTPTLGFVGPCPEGGSCPRFDATESMDVADHADHRPSNISVEAWVYLGATGVDRPVVVKANSTLTNGYGLFYSNASNAIVFFVNSGATAVGASITTGTWTHYLATFDGTNLRIYKNGVLVGGPTSASAITHSTTALRVGTHAAFANTWAGLIAHVAIYNVVLSADDALAHYTAGAWTDVTPDVHGRSGMTIRRGIDGSTPNDRMAGTGTATFTLNNHAGNSGGLQGYYSPGHANARSGFTFGIPVRISASYAGTVYPQFRGRLHAIEPDTGQYRTQRTLCTAHDVVRDLATQRVRQVGLQIDKSEADLIFEILESLPFEARPVGVSIDTGLDTYPYGFDTLGRGRAAQAILRDAVVSAQGLLTVDGEGMLRSVNRQSLALLETIGTINDDLLIDLQVPSDLDLVYNRVQVTTHPKRIDGSAVVLWSHDGVPSVAPGGGTLEVWADYRDPSNEDQLVGGTSMVTPVASTDYVANTAEDGSGSDITGSVTVSATFFASVVKLLITNNHGSSAAYFTTLQVRGLGVYDLSPVSVEASSTQPYGDRLLEIDLPFQDDANVAQGLADAIELQTRSRDRLVESFAMNPQRSPGEMISGLTIGYLLGLPLAISETMSGLQDATVLVRSMELEIQNGGYFIATFGTAPRLGTSVFILDTSELDDPEDVLSYA